MTDVTGVGDVRHSQVISFRSAVRNGNPLHTRKYFACSKITQDTKRKRHSYGVEHRDQVNHFLRHSPTDGG